MVGMFNAHDLKPTEPIVPMWMPRHDAFEVDRSCEAVDKLVEVEVPVVPALHAYSSKKGLEAAISTPKEMEQLVLINLEPFGSTEEYILHCVLHVVV